MGDVIFVLGGKRVRVSRRAARLVHDRSREYSVVLIELRSKIGAAIRAATPPPAEDDNQLDGEVSITATEDGQRAELFLELQALQEQGELEDGLLELKAAASEPIAPA